MAYEIFRSQSAVAKLRGNGDRRLAVWIAMIPLQQIVRPRFGIGADVCDLDADGTVVGCGRVPRPFLQVQRLINRSIQVQHEVHAQVALILQFLEALPARARDVIMDDELIHDALQQGQIPAASPHFFKLLRSQAARRAQAVAVRRSHAFHFRARIGPIGFVERREPPFDAIGIVAAGVHPQNDARARVKHLSGDHNFVTRAGLGLTRARHRAAAHCEKQWRDDSQRPNTRKPFHQFFTHDLGEVPVNQVSKAVGT